MTYLQDEAADVMYNNIPIVPSYCNNITVEEAAASYMTPC